MRSWTIRLSVGVAVFVYILSLLVALSVAVLYVRSPLASSLPYLMIAGAVAGLIVMGYFVRRWFDDEDGVREREFPWAVGIVLLFLHGVAPGLIAVGVYAVAEREFPIDWLFASLLAALSVLLVFSVGVAFDGVGLLSEVPRP